MEQHALERLETVMEQAGELSRAEWVPFDQLVNNTFAQKGHQLTYPLPPAGGGTCNIFFCMSEYRSKRCGIPLFFRIFRLFPSFSPCFLWTTAAGCAIFMMNTYSCTSPVSGQKGQILLRPTPAKQNIPRRILALLLLALMLSGLAIPVLAVSGSEGYVNTDEVHVRTGPGTGYASLRFGGSTDILLYRGQYVKILSTRKSSDGAAGIRSFLHTMAITSWASCAAISSPI